ncbi:MAG: hypothetical protein EOO15_00720 [Chitinophagaceae bacterium]|nr:MAG: hypothetical protein EOO15_00720 [Chitinophagaceae bacterium]
MDAHSDQLLSDFTILRDGYIKLMNDYDVLLHWSKPQLEALYLTRIGQWQIERLQAQLQVKALQRKIELFTAAVNTGEEPDLVAIELEVAEELAEAERLIMQESGKLELAQSLLSNLETPERSAELRTLYKKLAKALHPDVHPDLTEAHKELWLKVQDAYKSGDLERLKALELAYADLLQSTDTLVQELPQSELDLRCATLREGIRQMEDKIAQLCAAFPFTLQDQLLDEEWVAAQVAEIQGELKALNDYEQELRLEYENLINGHHG